MVAWGEEGGGAAHLLPTPFAARRMFPLSPFQTYSGILDKSLCLLHQEGTETVVQEYNKVEWWVIELSLILTVVPVVRQRAHGRN